MQPQALYTCVRNNAMMTASTSKAGVVHSFQIKNQSRKTTICTVFPRFSHKVHWKNCPGQEHFELMSIFLQPVPREASRMLHFHSATDDTSTTFTEATHRIPYMQLLANATTSSTPQFSHPHFKHPNGHSGTLHPSAYTFMSASSLEQLEALPPVPSDSQRVTDAEGRAFQGHVRCKIQLEGVPLDGDGGCDHPRCRSI